MVSTRGREDSHRRQEAARTAIAASIQSVAISTKRRFCRGPRWLSLRRWLSQRSEKMAVPKNQTRRAMGVLNHMAVPKRMGVPKKMGVPKDQGP